MKTLNTVALLAVTLSVANNAAFAMEHSDTMTKACAYIKQANEECLAWGQGAFYGHLPSLPVPSAAEITICKHVSIAQAECLAALPAAR